METDSSENVKGRWLPLFPIIMNWKSSFEPSRNTSVYENSFPSVINLDPYKTYGIAVESIDTYYSFPNIKDGINNVFKYSKNGTDVTLKIPTGCYDIDNINSTIKDLMGADGGQITISQIVPQLKSSITIANNFTVDFTAPNSINSILGFNSQVLNAGLHISENIVNINSTNSIFVNCDLISTSYVNGQNSPVIYSFFPNVPPGYKIIKELPRLDFIPINKSQINSIRVWLTDQDGNYLNFRNETITIRFYLGELV